MYVTSITDVCLYLYPTKLNLKTQLPHFARICSTLIITSLQKVLITRKHSPFNRYFHMREQYKIVRSKVWAVKRMIKKLQFCNSQIAQAFAE